MIDSIGYNCAGSIRRLSGRKAELRRTQLRELEVFTKPVPGKVVQSDNVNRW